MGLWGLPALVGRGARRRGVRVWMCGPEAHIGRANARGRNRNARQDLTRRSEQKGAEIRVQLNKQPANTNRRVPSSEF